MVWPSDLSIIPMNQGLVICHLELKCCIFALLPSLWSFITPAVMLGSRRKLPSCKSTVLGWCWHSFKEISDSTVPKFSLDRRMWRLQKCCWNMLTDSHGTTFWRQTCWLKATSAVIWRDSRRNLRRRSGTSSRGNPGGRKKLLLGRSHCCRCHFNIADLSAADVTALLVSALVRCTALVITLWLFAGLCNVPDYEHTVAVDTKIWITDKQRGIVRMEGAIWSEPMLRSSPQAGWKSQRLVLEGFILVGYFGVYCN